MKTVTLRELPTDAAVKYAKEKFGLEEHDAVALVTEITGGRFRDLNTYGAEMVKNSTRAQIDGVCVCVGVGVHARLPLCVLVAVHVSGFRGDARPQLSRRRRSRRLRGNS